jgi:hypothetical protein
MFYSYNWALSGLSCDFEIKFLAELVDERVLAF